MDSQEKETAQGTSSQKSSKLPKRERYEDAGPITEEDEEIYGRIWDSPEIQAQVAKESAQRKAQEVAAKKTVWVCTYGSDPAFKGQSLLTRLGYIGIGWPEGGDFTGLDTRYKILGVLEKYGKPDRAKLHSRDAGIIYRFMNVAQIGDVVVTRNREEQSIYVGTITSPYIYDTTQDEHFHNLRRVEWSYNVPSEDFAPSSLNLINKPGVFWQMRGDSSEYLKPYKSPKSLEG